jgi:hypothetical protein
MLKARTGTDDWHSVPAAVSRSRTADRPAAQYPGRTGLPEASLIWLFQLAWMSFTTLSGIGT